MLDSLQVVDSRGQAVELREDGSGVYTFAMPASRVSVKAVFAAGKGPQPFADVSEEAWYHDAVAYVYGHGIMDGVGDLAFAPDRTLTRAMAVQMLYNLDGKPEAHTGTAFEDVQEDAWYADALCWAAAAEIAGGYDDGTFRPDEAVTRQELALFLYRYEQSQGGGFQGMWAFPLDYPDASQAAAWANEALCWCTMKGVIQGRANGLLDADGLANRAEAAQMLMQFCKAQR